MRFPTEAQITERRKMKYTTRITSEHNFSDKKAVLHWLEQPSQEGHYALQLLGHFGLISGIDDGEDSAGRRAMKLMPVAETVERAFDLAHEAFIQLSARGLLIELPDPNELNKNADKKAEKRREEMQVV